MSRRPTRAELYARFSPRKDPGKSQSIETQLDLCREFCARTGLEVVAEFSDRSLSGADAARPGLWDAINALKRRWTLVVWKFDRLARDAFLSHLIERRLEKRGARVMSASGEGTIEAGLLPAERLRLGVLRLFAEFERDMIRQRTREAMRHHQANGRRMSDRCPFGWTRDLDNPALLVRDEAEQAVMGQMIKMRQTGTSLRDIARRLQAKGVCCRGRPTWHPRTIGRILSRAGVKCPLRIEAGPFGPPCGRPCDASDGNDGISATFAVPRSPKPPAAPGERPRPNKVRPQNLVQ